MSLWGLLKGLAGADPTPMPVAARRLAICEPCPDRIGSRCSICRCIVRRKVLVASEHCPLGRW